MLRSVLLKTLRDQRRSLVWWVVGLVAYAALIVAFYPTVRDNPEFQELAEVYPEELLALMGIEDMSEIFTPEGYLNAEMFALMVPILLVVFAIAAGTGAIAGEEEWGTLEVLLTEPITRRRLVMEKFGAMALATLALGLVLWMALFVGSMIVGMDISFLSLLGGSLSVVLLGLVFGGLAFAAGSVFGSRGPSIGISAGVAVATYVLNALSSMVEVMEPARWLSPFFYYNGASPLVDEVSPGYVVVLVGLITVALAVALVAFERRDLRL